jgi:4-hydroxy-tetrahydrodipicolinate synthase
VSVPFPRGVYAPVATVFSDDDLDVDATVEHVRMVAARGPHGILVGGSGGEFIAMSLDERLKLTEAVADVCGQSLPFIVGVAAFATRDVLQLARHAEAVGATAVLVTAPYLARPQPAAVRRHFDALRGAIELPIMLYNTPAQVGVSFSRQEIERLVDDGVLQAVKMSFPEAYRLRDLKATLEDRAAVYCGHDGSALESLIVGADGWISCIPLCFPERAVRLWDAVAQREPLDSLLEQWYQLLPFVRFLYEDDAKINGDPHWLETLKSTLTMLGHPVGLPRAPLGALPPIWEEQLRRILADLGELRPAAQTARV